MVRPTGLEGFRFSMVCPTDPGGFVFQWSAQRVCGVGVELFFNGSPNAPGGVSFFNGSPNAPGGVSFFNGPPNAPGGVSFFNGSPNAPGRVSFFNGPPNGSAGGGFVFQWCAQRVCAWRHTNPLKPHSPPAPCYMCYMCYMGLTRQPAELYTIHIASQHVPNMPCIAHIVYFNARINNI